MKEKKCYMILKNKEILPHTARKNKQECIELFAEELSDEYKNPDMDSILSEIENGSFDGSEIECKLVRIEVL